VLRHQAPSGWNPYLDHWIPSNKLTKGERLQTPDGTLAVADGGTTPKIHDGWMWDLTVPGNNDHDFYVLATSDGQNTMRGRGPRRFWCTTMIPPTHLRSLEITQAVWINLRYVVGRQALRFMCTIRERSMESMVRQVGFRSTALACQLMRRLNWSPS